jgi:hypothetical protein
METQENITSQKTEYTTPQVIDYGAIESLTQSGGTGAPDAFDGSSGGPF